VDSENIAISLPNNVEVIGNFCFANSGIKKFIINGGSKLKKLPTRSFTNCEKLENVDISESLEISTIEDFAFYNCTSLESVLLANTITYINDYAFDGCKNISSITLPSSLLKLGNNCLNTTIKTNIKIPSSLITPPVFTYNGRESNKSYPFGDPSESDANTPNIVVPTIQLNSIYKNNTYWKIYKHNIIINMTESPEIDIM
jgi:hypothetical protein